MNNMKYYNDSLAYDFEMFAPKKKEIRDNVVVMPSQSKSAGQRRRRATRRVSAPALLIMCAFIVLAGLCGNITLRLKINEVNKQIRDVNTEIAKLDSEKTELEVEMQRRLSFSNLELEAVELGMKRPEKENVVYIRANDKDAARMSDGKLVMSE